MALTDNAKESRRYKLFFVAIVFCFFLSGPLKLEFVGVAAVGIFWGSAQKGEHLNESCSTAQGALNCLSLIGASVYGEGSEE